MIFSCLCYINTNIIYNKILNKNIKNIIKHKKHKNLKEHKNHNNTYGSPCERSLIFYRFSLDNLLRCVDVLLYMVNKHVRVPRYVKNEHTCVAL